MKKWLQRQKKATDRLQTHTAKQSLDYIKNH